MNSKQTFKVREGKERVREIKAFLVFPVAAFYFAVVPWRIGAD